LVAVRDRVTGAGRHRVTWRWHLDPACEATLDGDDCRLRTPTAEIWLMPVGRPPSELRITEGWISKSYGVKTPTKVVMVDAEVTLPVSFSYLFADTRLDDGARAHAALLSTGRQRFNE